YLEHGGRNAASIGQVIVKESWVADEITVAQGDTLDGADRAQLVHKEGKWYLPGRQADLFIMTKLNTSGRGTDDGWIYGTVTSDGETVTSAGRVESCMNCHQTGTVDRLFGLKARE